MKLVVEMTIERDQEDDGRWIAEVKEYPGVMAYGKTLTDATRRVVVMALRVEIDRWKDMA